MTNDYWIESVFEKVDVLKMVQTYSMRSECGQRLCMRLNIRKTFRIFIEKGMVNQGSK